MIFTDDRKKLIINAIFCSCTELKISLTLFPLVIRIIPVHLLVLFVLGSERENTKAFQGKSICFSFSLPHQNRKESGFDFGFVLFIYYLISRSNCSFLICPYESKIQCSKHSQYKLFCQSIGIGFSSILSVAQEKLYLFFAGWCFVLVYLCRCIFTFFLCC